MKQAEKLSIAAGIVILGFAAVIAISFMFHFLDFGFQSAFVFKLGNFGAMLYGVYGLSSVLIPVYLIVASILLFLPGWTTRRGSYLVFSILPFFTISGIEKLCRAFFAGTGLSFFLIKYSALVIISALLVAIEYLVFGLILDSAAVSARTKQEQRNTVEPPQPTSDTTPVEQSDSSVILAPSSEDFHAPDDKPENNQLGYENAITDENLIYPAPHLEHLNELELAEPDDEPVTEPEQMEIPTRFGPEELSVKEVTELIQDNPSIVTPLTDNQIDEIESEQEPVEAQQIITMQFGGLDESEPEWVTEDYIPEPGEEDIDIPLPPPAEDLYNSDEDAFMNDPFAMDDDVLSEDEKAALEAERSTYEEEFNQLTQAVAEVTDTVSPSAEEIDDDAEDGTDIDEDSDEPDYTDYPEDTAIPQEQQNPAPTAPVASGRVYAVPTEGLLNSFAEDPYWIIDEKTKLQGAILKETLNEFKIEAEVTDIRKGPVVTMFEILPAPGIKLQKIVGLQDNIALRLAASSVRIVAPIPGKQAVGIEVPNPKRAVVSFRELIERDLPEASKMAIPVVLGKDITGDAQMLDIATTPHLLIAGSTGSGKSVCVNSIILSILYKRSPDEVKMLLIDPKVVELKLYNDIPHLLSPVITEPKKAFQALQYCLCEMERRYAMLDRMGVRDIKTYNKRIKERNIMQEKMPYIVVIIDEFADLMATTGKELESTVARLAAMSRAVGIHLILATQRPSIDVITGLIKANIPTRIAFMVASKTDSRIIIDQVGAEKLLGKGDMLYASAVDPYPVRLQGTFVTEDEVERVVDYVKTLAPPQYIDDEIFVDDEDDELAESLFSDGEDPLYDQALEIVLQAGKASASYIQRRLKIGYNRAARLVEDMEARGIVGPANGSKPREIVHYPS